jgi:hypothetical protein
MPTGVLLMFVNDEMIETTEELDQYKTREEAGEKFQYKLEMAPIELFKIVQYDDGTYGIFDNAKKRKL